MELQQLRYFHEVARDEHVTRAARRIHIAQPSLTHALHLLEEELGVKLIERSGRNIRLTPEGHLLESRLEKLLPDIDALPGELRELAAVEDRTVSIDVAAASAIVIDAVSSYHERYPSVRFLVRQRDVSDADIRIGTIPIPKAEARPKDGEAGGGSSAGASDVAGDVACGAPTDGTEETRIFDERILLAVPGTSHRQGAHMHLDEVADEPFISLTDSKGFRTICDDACARHSFTPEVVFESDNPSLVRKMIAAGMGVGFWPERSWGVVKEEDIHLIPVAEDGFERRILVTVVPRRVNRACVDDFAGFLIGCFEEIWGRDR